jgi:predicted CopG family antitoxin
VPPKGYITVYVKQDVFEQLMLLRARLRKRSVNDVIKELIEAYERLHENSWVRQCLQ